VGCFPHHPPHDVPRGGGTPRGGIGHTLWKGGKPADYVPNHETMEALQHHGPPAGPAPLSAEELYGIQGPDPWGSMLLHQAKSRTSEEQAEASPHALPTIHDAASLEEVAQDIWRQCVPEKDSTPSDHAAFAQMLFTVAGTQLPTFMVPQLQRAIPCRGLTFPQMMQLLGEPRWRGLFPPAISKALQGFNAPKKASHPQHASAPREVPRGEALRGEAPRGEAPRGETPGGEVPRASSLREELLAASRSSSSPPEYSRTNTHTPEYSRPSHGTEPRVVEIPVRVMEASPLAIEVLGRPEEHQIQVRIHVSPGARQDETELKAIMRNINASTTAVSCEATASQAGFHVELPEEVDAKSMWMRYDPAEAIICVYMPIGHDMLQI